MSRQPRPTPPAPRSYRRFVSTWLIVAGMATLVGTVALPAWQTHQRAAETAAFLARVATPSGVPGRAISTPRPPAGTERPRTVDRAIVAAPAPPLPPTVAPSTGMLAPSPAAPPRMPRPTHLTIPAIKVDAEIVEVGVSPTEIDGQPAVIWDVPAYAVGHHFSSANPGEGENVVFSAHDDWQGEVFKNLYKLKKGDDVRVRAGEQDVRYRVDELLLLPEAGQPLAQREANTRFIGTTGDERLTLITCWPYGVDDHRLIVIARPAG